MIKPLLLLALLPELIVFTDGRFLKVTSYSHEGTRYVLTLTNGGTVTIPDLRVEQIIQDEVVEEEEVPEEKGPISGLSYMPSFQDLTVPHREEIYTAAELYDLHPTLLAAVIRAESNFNPLAVSPKGAMGLMQLMPSTCQRFGVINPYDPSQNIDAGARFLSYLKNRFEGDLSLVLAAYNAGEHTVQTHGGVPDYRETRTYVNRVKTFMKEYQERDMQHPETGPGPASS